ncbi:hydrogenase maturation protease [bacterium]|nr:hydrogenase maturation protease [bacterium]
MSPVSSNSRPLVLGIGNRLRGDDGAGGMVAARLRAAMPTDAVDCRTLDGEVASIIDAWAGRRLAIVIDCAVSGAPPGSIRRFDATAAPIPALFAKTSTHGIGLPEAIELARALGLMPGRLIVYAIEGKRFGMDGRVSPEIEQALIKLTGMIEEDVESNNRRGGDA